MSAVVLVGSMLGGVPTPAAAAPAVTYTYVIASRGSTADLDEFARQAAETLADWRGWNLGGVIAFEQVSSGGDFTLWLSANARVPSFGGACSRYWSCRSGRNIVINEDRWVGASPAWNDAAGSLRDYRHMVINHEVGHWLGRAHASCGGAGEAAPVMQQQSKGLDGCRFNSWPLGWERDAVARARGLEVNTAPPPPTWVGIAASGDAEYFTASSAGEVVPGGGAIHAGDLDGVALAAPIVGIAADPDDDGYWLVGGDGGVFSFNADFSGSTGALRLNQPVVGMAAHPGGGYWLVARDGGVFSFGGAPFYGSTGAVRLNQPIVGMAPTEKGDGYWLVAADGGVFSFGSAGFHGSTGGTQLSAPIVGMAADPDGSGYVLAGRDGASYRFDARWDVAPSAQPTTSPVTGVAVTKNRWGYLLVTADGKVIEQGTSSG